MQLHNLIRKDRWPLYVAIIIFISLALILLCHVLNTNGGIFSLPYENAYLQLSTAKTLAFRHIWGIGYEDFSAASPSLLYPLVLAITFFISGVHLAVAPAINTVIAIVLLASIQKWLAKRSVNTIRQLILLIAVLILSPLPVMVIYGMESPLLLLMAFLFTSGLADEWQLSSFSRSTLLYGALMVATRYDGMLLIAAACLSLVWQRRWLIALELALWGVLPILVFGFFSLSKGGFFLPNLFFVSTNGSVLGYDWLIGCTVALSVPLLRDYFSNRPIKKFRFIPGLSALAAVLLLMTTNLYAIANMDHSRIELYRTKYPIAQFAHRYFHYSNMVSDDVAMISYFSNGRYLDLSGAATAKMACHSSDAEFIHKLIREQGSYVAIVGSGCEKDLPDSWIKTAAWAIPGNDTCILYADSLNVDYLRRSVQDYNLFLPHGTSVRYFYTAPSQK